MITLKISKKYLKRKPWLYQILFRILKAVNYFSISFHLSYSKKKPSAWWQSRIDIVTASPDNKYIPRVKDAGKICKRHQIMHNGLKIGLGSYYQLENALLIEKNQGVHEPQEEYAFQEVLKLMPNGATMVELGSYWAFYSMWFASAVSNYNCYLIEPDPHNLLVGKWNFQMNKLKGNFKHAIVANRKTNDKTPAVLSIDSLVEEQNIDFIDILHSDIQGYEYEMLLGAKRAFETKIVGYIFISTHSAELHTSCKRFLLENNFEIVCDADLEASYSWDGLIVARCKNYGNSISISIHRRDQKNIP